MSAKRKHISLPYTSYVLCKSTTGDKTNKSKSNCKECLRLYAEWKLMIFELESFGSKDLNANHILKKYNFVKEVK